MYVRQLLESQPRFGGHPGVAGRRADAHGRWVLPANGRAGGPYRRPGQRIEHTIQTNATLITDEWAAFFKENDFLVGVSIDGPGELHDTYRVDKRGGPTFHKVMRGFDRLRAHGVRRQHPVHGARRQPGQPVEVYRFFRDDCDASFVQFIPIVERPNRNGIPVGHVVTERSVTAEGWGAFLNAVFDEWLRHDVGTVFVQIFDAALASWLRLPASLCVFAETCGTALALEHNGDVYSCDHFVEPDHLLGNIQTTHLVELVASPQQRRFGEAKRATLPQYCLQCDVRFACNGECPKNRFTQTPDGEPGLNYLCAGYKDFFHHVDGPMRLMADLLRGGRNADEIMDIFARAPRNEPCPCGGGRKAKHCHRG